MDPTDARPPFVKVANSIRAAILTGEFKGGDQLPSGHELAKFFGVARMTVQQSIRLLREEGFVTSQAGSGVFVREHPAPVHPDGASRELSGVINFFHEMGLLKRLPRSGWLLLGVSEPETVAEHSFRAAIIGLILAAMEGADIGRTVSLCLMHDSPESRVGDIPNVGRAYVNTVKAEAVSNHQTASMPAALSTLVRDLIREYEAGDTTEAQLARDADKIETLLQAREYKAQAHYSTDAWEETSLASLRTDGGKRLAQAATSTDPEEWWQPFARTYHELRRASRGKR